MLRSTRTTCFLMLISAVTPPYGSVFLLRTHMVQAERLVIARGIRMEEVPTTRKLVAHSGGRPWSNNGLLFSS